MHEIRKIREPRSGWSALFAIALFATPAHADMLLDRSILVFDADTAPRQDVEILNTGEDTLYLATEVLVVSDPGTDEETRARVDDPDGVGLLVTPARSVVPSGGRQLLRIVALEEPDAVDRIYRVNVRPVLPPLEAEQTAVKVVVAYQLLIIQRPESASADLIWSRDGRQIRFDNRGNSNVLLFNGRQCPSGADEDDASCVDLGIARRLYAGNQWNLELPFDAPVEFTTTIGQTNARRRFD